MPEEQTDVSQFFSRYQSKKFKRGEVILNPCAKISQIFYLESGFVKQYLLTKDGRVKAVNIYKPGSYFHIIMALARAENRYFFEAIDDVSVNQAPVEAVLDLMRQEPKITLDLFKRFSGGMDGVLNIMQSLMYEASQKKLAAFLLMLCQRFGKRRGNYVKITIPLTHQDLASFTGMIRETISFEMKKLQEKGIVVKNNSRKAIEIKNLIGLQNIVLS